MDFVTIDFETATPKRNSACSIGITIVTDNKVEDTITHLIKPPGNKFDRFNISIHGITPSDVIDEPYFDGVWSKIVPLIENKTVIAHNASFDISVLRNSLDFYNIKYPDFNYVCSYLLAKRIWTDLPTYNLKSLCNQNNIDFIHHDAGEDSLAAAKLMLTMLEAEQINSLSDLHKKTGLNIGRVYDNGYSPCGMGASKREYSVTKFDHIASGLNIDEDNIFYGKNVLFTGKLLSYERTEAAKVIIEIGGNVSSGISKKVDFLIVGDQDFKVVGETGMSTKQRKAIELKSKGADIEIMSERDFLKNI